MLKNKGFRVVFVGLGLILLFVCPVLAVEPVKDITGWDKAKFGMSPKDLKSVYREDIEELDQSEFYRKERGYRWLSFIKMVRGLNAYVYFYFVNKKLFEVQIIFFGRDEFRIKRRFLLLSYEMEHFLKRKYLFLSPPMEEKFKNLEVLQWEDEEGDRIVLTRGYRSRFSGRFTSSEREEFSIEPTSFMYWLEIAYCDGELTEVWEKKIGEKKGYEEVEIENF